MRSVVRSALAIAAGVSVALVPLSVVAAPGNPPPAKPANAPAAMTPPVEVHGFRSAKFGMTEADVKAAIAKDFGVKSDAIKSEANSLEKTQILSVTAPDVLPGGGKAEISYVFGYKSRTLIQVGLTWSKAIDDKITQEQLFANSTMLRSHFLSSGYKPDTVATNMPVSNGLLMFRGSDNKGHTTLLILQGPTTQGQNNQRVLTPTALLLFYLADAKTPDVYRLPDGSF